MHDLAVAHADDAAEQPLVVVVEAAARREDPGVRRLLPVRAGPGGAGAVLAQHQLALAGGGHVEALPGGARAELRQPPHAPALAIGQPGPGEEAGAGEGDKAPRAEAGAEEVAAGKDGHR